MSDKNKISIFVYVSILINLIVLALFITFVFGLKKDAFDVDTKKLDKNAGALKTLSTADFFLESLCNIRLILVGQAFRFHF